MASGALATEFHLWHKCIRRSAAVERHAQLPIGSRRAWLPAVAPVACLVHCALGALLAPVLPLAGHEGLEWAIVLAAFVLAAPALLRDPAARPRGVALLGGGALGVGLGTALGSEALRLAVVLGLGAASFHAARSQRRCCAAPAALGEVAAGSSPQ